MQILWVDSALPTPIETIFLDHSPQPYLCLTYLREMVGSPDVSIFLAWDVIPLSILSTFGNYEWLLNVY